MPDETLEKVFTVSSPIHLSVSNLRGSIHVSHRAGSEAHITAIKHSDSGDVSHTYIEIEQPNEGMLQIRTRLQQPTELSQVIRPCAVTFSISLPKPVSIKIRSVCSDVNLEDMEGDFDLQTVSGNMTLKRLNGTIKSNSVSGNIFGEALCGKLALKTVSGTIRLDESTLSSCEIATVNGHTTLETSIKDGPYSFDSLCGNVTLIVPPESGCEPNFKSMSGKFFSDLSTTYIKRQGRLAEIVVQNGGATVQHNSLSGNMYITSTKE